MAGFSAGAAGPGPAGSPRARCTARLAALIAAVLLVGCADVVPEATAFAEARCQTVIDDGVDGAPTYEVGVILEVHQPGGAVDALGVYTTQAMRLALQELNDHRDIAGKRLRLRVCDTRADWSTGGGPQTRDLARWLVEKANVQAIISDASSDTQTIASVTVPAGVLLMAISATSAELTHLADKGLVWRVAPSDVYQGIVLAHLATESLPANARVGVIAVQSPYGDGLVDAMDARLGKRVVTRTVQSDAKGIDAAVQSLATEDVQALVVIGNAAVAVGVANRRAQHDTLKQLPMWFADGACDGELLKQPLANGVSLAGVKCTRPGQPPTAVYEKFRERYQQQFKSDPATYSYTQHAFDATYCVALAHAWALGSKGSGKVSGASLAEGLRQLSSGPPLAFKPSDITAMIAALSQGKAIDVEGASSPLNFNPDTGEAPSDYELWTLGPAGALASNAFVEVRDSGGGQYTVLPVAVTGT